MWVWFCSQSVCAIWFNRAMNSHHLQFGSSCSCTIAPHINLAHLYRLTSSTPRLSFMPTDTFHFSLSVLRFLQEKKKKTMHLDGYYADHFELWPTCYITKSKSQQPRFVFGYQKYLYGSTLSEQYYSLMNWNLKLFETIAYSVLARLSLCRIFFNA